MKKEGIFILFCFLARSLILSQSIDSCLPQGIQFNSQEQIDSFSFNYPGCKFIIGDVGIDGADIQFLTGLKTLDSIGGNLYILDCPVLHHLQGLDSLQYVGGYFQLIKNGLSDLSGLDSLNVVGGKLEINRNQSLNSLSGLGGLDSIIGTLDISENHSLSKLDGLESLKRIGGDLYVYFNNGLFDITGLESLHLVGGNVSISSNPLLTHLSGLEGLDSIQGYLNIGSNNLNDILGFDSIRFIGNSLSIRSNPMLTTLPKWVALDSISTGLMIFDNALIKDLKGLESLRFIGTQLLILSNSSLTQLEGLDSLTSFSGLLDIEDNNLLDNIFALNHLHTGAINHLTIRLNQNLSACNMISICNFLTAGGFSEIDNNAIGCNSAEEVEISCLLGVQNSAYHAGIRIFPNPTSASLEISGLENTDFTFTLHDVYGQKYFGRNSSTTSIYLGDLPSGMYLLTIQWDGNVVNEKIIKKE